MRQLAMVLALAALLPMPVATAPSCLTHAQARAKWPNQHLRWHGNARCWDNAATRHRRLAKAKREKARIPAVEEPRAQAVVPVLNPIVSPLVPLPIRTIAVSPMPAVAVGGALDAGEPADAIIYSSFDGAIPDVWPPPDPPSTVTATFVVGFGGLIVVTLFWLPRALRQARFA